ncbi:TRAP transporter fused permease subunit [Janibacter melonis]|uniref:TRAP transporter permease n=1 Tax=Janibacter melonis TaxID=262209 RepID=UPI00177E9E2C|nr:TRAP transporter permease [Janibacter melonis]
MTDSVTTVREQAWRAFALVVTLLGLFLVLNQVFLWDLLGGGMLRNEFLYYLLACFGSLVFVFFRARKVAPKDGPDAVDELEAPGAPLPPSRFAVPWYDAVLVAVTAATNIYFAVNAENIATLGWDYAAPTTAVVLSYVLWGLTLEALRRTAGLVVTVIAGVFSLYPMIAGSVPVGFLQGIQFDSNGAAMMHALGSDSILGLPLQTAAVILVGFLLFGVVLQRTGGADFFVDLARGALGASRGGSAKVAVGSSAAMGMMSGSAVSNVLTTGPMTIPAMKRAGYPARYAGGIEATAATGGSITPPIMGTAAFLMVSFLGIPYSEVAIAAAIPAALYYLGIFTQVDAYAARSGLRGEPRSMLPKVLPTLAAGWPYVLAIAVLTFLLVVRKDEAQAPFVTVALMLVIALVRRSGRVGIRDLGGVVLDTGRSVAEIFGIIAGVGLIVGGLSMSGVSLSLARELVAAVGDNVLLILVAGAITCFVLGMGMTVSAVYVFLAIVMAPALVALGVDPVAAHLFVIYWAAASYITPPVALAAFAAAGIAKAPPMATGFTAMKLGAVKYIIPFCFALNPALVAQADAGEIAYTFAFAVVGVVFMGSAFEGWLPVVERPLGLLTRVVAFGAGLAMLAPELTSSLAGLVVGAALAVALRVLVERPELPEAVDAPVLDRVDA